MRLAARRYASDAEGGAIAGAAVALFGFVVLLFTILEIALFLAFAASVQITASQAAHLARNGADLATIEQDSGRLAFYAERIVVGRDQCWNDLESLGNGASQACGPNRKVRRYLATGTWTFLTPVARTLAKGQDVEVNAWSVVSVVR